MGQQVLEDFIALAGRRDRVNQKIHRLQEIAHEEGELRANIATHHADIERVKRQLAELEQALAALQQQLPRIDEARMRIGKQDDLNSELQRLNAEMGNKYFENYKRHYEMN